MDNEIIKSITRAITRVVIISMALISLSITLEIVSIVLVS